MDQDNQKKQKRTIAGWLFLDYSNEKAGQSVGNQTMGVFEEQDLEKQNKRQLSAKETIGVFGFGILISWLFLSYFSGSFFFGESNNSFGRAGGMQLVGLGVFSIATALYLIRSDFFAKINVRRFFIIPLLSGLVLPASAVISWLWMPIPTLFQIVIWAINGFASACTMLMWANYFCRLSKEVIIPSIIVASLVAGLWYLLIQFLPANIKGIGVYASLVLSLVCIMIYLQESSSIAFISRKDSQSNIGLAIKTSVSLFISGCAQGYLLHRVLMEMPTSAIGIICCSFILSAAISWVVNKVFGRYSLLLAPYFRLTFFPLMVGFALIPFLSSAALIVCYTIMLALLFEHWLSLFVNITYAIKKYEVQSFFLWVRVHIPTFIGLTLGWGMGCVVLTFYDPDMYGAFTVVLVYTLLFMLMLAASVTVAPYGCDHLTIPEDYRSDDESSEYRAARKAWGKACEIVARRSGLTPRETEVFMLLAKGRNSRVIERELSISNHTVKSHNYNIYRKLEVDSQQELIDVIESVHSKIKITIQ